MNKEANTPTAHTLKTLIYLAKGKKRTMSQYAADSKISPAALYRLANENFSRPLSEERLQALADNAAPESGVTYEMLYEAMQRITARKRPEEKMSITQATIGALVDKALHTPNSTISRCIHPNIALLSRDNGKDTYFALSLKVGISSQEQSSSHIPFEEYCYFRIINKSLDTITIEELYQFTGRIMHSARPSQNEHYYLVFVSEDTKQDDKKADSTVRLLPARRTDAPFNLSVILANYINGIVPPLNEIVVLGKDSLITFD